MTTKPKAPRRGQRTLIDSPKYRAIMDATKKAVLSGLPLGAPSMTLEELRERLGRELPDQALGDVVLELRNRD